MIVGVLRVSVVIRAGLKLEAGCFNEPNDPVLRYVAVAGGRIFCGGVRPEDT